MNYKEYFDRDKIGEWGIIAYIRSVVGETMSKMIVVGTKCLLCYSVINGPSSRTGSEISPTVLVLDWNSSDRGLDEKLVRRMTKKQLTCH